MLVRDRTGMNRDSRAWFINDSCGAPARSRVLSSNNSWVGSSASCLYLVTPRTAHQPKGGALLPRLSGVREACNMPGTDHSSQQFTCFFRGESGTRHNTVPSRSHPVKVAAVLRLPRMLSPPDNTRYSKEPTKLRRMPLWVDTLIMG